MTIAETTRNIPKPTMALILTSDSSCCAWSARATRPPLCGLMCSMLSLQDLRHQVMIDRQQRPLTELIEENREPYTGHGNRQHYIEQVEVEMPGEPVGVCKIRIDLPEAFAYAREQQQC